MNRPLICVVLATALGLVMPAPANGAETFHTCTGFISSLPATITSQGTWCLDRNLSTSVASGAAITIAAHNVTLDCNHFKIGGLAAGTDTSTVGVLAYQRFNATVRNCNIRGFLAAIDFGGGGGHLVEDNVFDGSTYRSVYVYAAASTIRDNLIIDTGGSTDDTGAAYGIVVGAGVDILDNTINGVAPIGANGDAYGISANFNGDGSVNGNRIRGLEANGNGVSWAITTNNSPGMVIRDNDLKGPGPNVADGIGIRCGSNAETARGNVVARFETGIANCLSSSNVVNTN